MSSTILEAAEGEQQRWMNLSAHTRGGSASSRSAIGPSTHELSAQEGVGVGAQYPIARRHSSVADRFVAQATEKRPRGLPNEAPLAVRSKIPAQPPRAPRPVFEMRAARQEARTTARQYEQRERGRK